MKEIFRIKLLSILLLAVACTNKNTEFEIGQNVDDYFHVINDEYAIPVWVRGNTESKRIIIYVQGGPAQNTMDFATIDYPGWKETLEKDYAIAYYEQRGNGNKQGNFDLGENVLDTYVSDLHKISQFLKSAYDSEIILMGHSFGGSLVLRYIIEHPNDGVPIQYISLNGPVTTDVGSSEKRWEFRREFLYNTALLEISRNHNVTEWNEVLNWLDQTPVIEKLNDDEPYRLMNQWNAYVEELVYKYYEEKQLGLKEYLQVFRTPYNPIPAYLGDDFKTDDDLGSLIFASEEQYQLINRLSEIDQQSVLLVTGRYDDICVPEEMEYAFDQIVSPGKKLEIVDYAGHDSFIHNPDALNAIIKNFIQ